MADKARSALATLRARIDEVDDRLAELVGERLRLTTQAADLKADGPSWVPWREEAILDRVTMGVKAAPTSEDLKRFFRHLFRLGRASQNGSLVRYPWADTLGKGSAPLWEVLDPGESLPAPALDEAIARTCRSPRETILLPAQIGWEGGGMSMLPRLAQADLSIHAAILRSITWCVAWKEASQEPSAVSVPTGLEAFVAGSLPEALRALPRTGAFTAAAAAEKAANKANTVAAVTTQSIADRLGLAVRLPLQTSSMPRRARYLVASAAPSEPPVAERWSLIVGAPQPAVLGTVLATLAGHGMHPVHIEHHRIEAIFAGPLAFLDLVGKLEAKTREQAFRAIEKAAPYVRGLGAYPIIRV